jgi:hypothetical protein
MTTDRSASFEPHRRRLLVYRRLGSMAEAEDAVQDVSYITRGFASLWRDRMRYGLVFFALLPATAVTAQQPANPRQQPGATVTMFAPEQHDLYDGHYVLSANRIYMVGGLNDPVGWDHLDNDAKTVKPVVGTAEIDVNDLTNSALGDV